jgi:3-oxoacyl-[acyl-carrier protein] reductase
MSDLPTPDFTRLGPAPGSRIAVVGGCGGIGRAIVAAARTAALQIAVLDLPVSMEAHPPGNDVLAYPLDATDEDQVAQAIADIGERWGTLDALVNLAGFTVEQIPIADMEAEVFDEIIDGNLRSAFLTCKHALPLLKAEGGGAIVNTASGLGMRLLPGYGPYGASKAGTVALTKALAVENGPQVRANAIAPGPVDTDFLRGGTGRLAGTSNAFDFDHETFNKIAPLGRIAVPDDIAGPVLFLAGDAARFMTGQTLYINGGILTP